MVPPRNETPRRKNGFSPPYAPAQLSTWVALPVLVVEFVLVVAPILPLEAMIPCIIVYGLSAVLSAYYAYLAQAIDPMDEHLAKHLKRLENGDENNDGNGFGACLGNPGDTVEELKHCWICETQVSAQAMHCKFCNKCVGNFDHHCVWLNTCVGKANYRYFLLTMIYITIMLIIHGSIQIALIIDIFLGGSSETRANEWFDAGQSEVVLGILIAFIVFDALALSLILQLLWFHMQLRREGLTTYKFIVRETQRKREKSNQEEVRKNQRTVAMGKAHDEGKGCLMIRLRYGELFPCCDPLPPLEDDKREDEEVPPAVTSTQPPPVESDDSDEEDEESSPDIIGATTNGDTGNDPSFIKVNGES